MMFSTDYPHWDFDDPARRSQGQADGQDQKAKLFRDNARALYGLA